MPEKNDLPFYECSRYARCSVNNCPLHPDYPNLAVDSEDAEKKCQMKKTIRIKIAEKFPGILTYGGRTQREFTGMKTWDNMSDEKKEICKSQVKNLTIGVTQVKQECGVM